MAALVAAATGIGAASPGPSSFGYTAEIIVPPGAARHAVRLPATVQRHVAYPDLRDVRVFNGAGEVLPHSVRWPPAPPAPERRLRPALHAVPEAPGRPGDPEPVAFEVDASGAILAIRLRSGVPRALTARTAEWILDTGPAHPPLSGLDLVLAPGPDPVFMPVSVEASPDLLSWKPVARDEPVFRLPTGGEPLVRRLIRFPATDGRYLRLRPGKESRLPLLAVDALIADGAAAPMVSATFDGEESETPGRAWEYDTGARLAAEEASLVLPGEDTVLQLEIQTRQDPRVPWQPAGRGTAFRLARPGATLVGEPFPVAAPPARFYRAQLTTPPGRMPSRTPRLLLRWRPPEIVFEARGPGPYLLAYGKFSSGIAAAVPDDGAPSMRATLGPETVAAGETAREPPDRRRRAWPIIAGIAALGAAGVAAWIGWQRRRDHRPSPRSPGI